MDRKKRGFLTIAIGQERYYKLARNLLYSYRYFADRKYPFVLLTDKENEYTMEFDAVIIIDSPNYNYLDKLKLYDYAPFDETIFIDADSLAYGNLNEWWNLFENATDFSCFGYMWTDLNSGRGWFIPNGIKEFKECVNYIPDFNGGIYFLRKSETCKKVFELANYLSLNYEKYAFTDFKAAADEPCLALAMAVYQCKPIDILDGGFVFAPKATQIDADITIPKAHFYRSMDLEYDVNMIHWSNYRTRKAFYKFEVEKLIKMRNGKAQGIIYIILYKFKIKYFVLKFGDIIVFICRLWKKIKDFCINTKMELPVYFK